MSSPRRKELTTELSDITTKNVTKQIKRINSKLAPTDNSNPEISCAMRSVFVFCEQITGKLLMNKSSQPVVYCYNMMLGVEGCMTIFFTIELLILFLCERAQYILFMLYRFSFVIFLKIMDRIGRRGCWKDLRWGGVM